MYQQVSGEDGMSFAIKRTELIYDRFQGQKDEPHRHSYYTVVFNLEADGVHHLDFKAYPMSDQQIWFVAPGQVHQIDDKARPKGYALTFSERFLEENSIDCRFIEDIGLFQSFDTVAALEPASHQLEILTQYVEAMLKQQEDGGSMAYQAIGALLKLFLITCYQACDAGQLNPQLAESGSSLLRDFRRLLDEHHHEWHQVRDYAEKLFVTPDHLNRTVKQMVGQTAKAFLQARVLVEAKRKLRFEDRTVKEIAFDLGFRDASHFGSFFKKHSGVSPKVFREKRTL